MSTPGFERFKFSPPGYRDIMKSDAVEDDLVARGNRVKAAAESDLDDPEWDVRVDLVKGRNRSSVTVFGVPMRVEADRRVLGRAIDAAK